MLSITISRVAGFSVYQKAKYILDDAIERSTGKSPLKLANTPGTYPDLATVTCFTTAGAISGAALAVILSPFELVKNATQTSVLMSRNDIDFRGPAIGSIEPKGHGRVNSWLACKQIVQRRGFLGLWTGFQLHLLRDVAGTGIYFGVYEATKQAITTYSGVGKPNTATAVATAGMLCGVMSWVATYPLDTMKTRVQNTLVGTTNKISPSPLPITTSPTLEAAAAFVTRSSKWQGVEMIILRSSIQNMIQMSIFEWVKKYIIAMEFSDGRTDLPKTRRESGRTSPII